jgi:hypothetical protein
MEMSLLLTEPHLRRCLAFIVEQEVVFSQMSTQFRDEM